VVVERPEYAVKRLVRPTDIHHHAVGIELLRHEGRIDHESRAMQRLRRPKQLAAKRMSNHDVVANFDGKQGYLPP